MAETNLKLKVEFQKALEELQKGQKEVQKCLETRQKLETQLTENTVVKEELDFLEADSLIFKLTGPVLVKQDLPEAKQTVGKRIEYISQEIKRQDKAIENIEKEQEKHKDSLKNIQSQLPVPAGMQAQ